VQEGRHRVYVEGLEPTSMEPAIQSTPVTLRPHPVLKWLRTHFLEPTLWRLPRTSDVLDLCCGYGFYLSINPRARAVDGNPECVAQLRQEGRDVLLCDVLGPLPFSDGEFGWVVAHDVCEHFTYEQLVGVFREVHRVLRPGGTFLAFVPNRRGYEYGLRAGAGHVLFVTASEILALSRGLFELHRHHPEPLPRWIGELFTHNKEVFHLRRA
jgi:SAM-dependent methyltransferase